MNEDVTIIHMLYESMFAFNIYGSILPWLLLLLHTNKFPDERVDCLKI